MSNAPGGYYSSRAERAQFVASSFAPFLSGRVLDVGCGDALLKEHVANHVGIDVSGKPDIIVDLDRGGLPFMDRAFDAAVCIDVLEHVEPLADVLTDLFRVANRYVIISLPNMYALGWRLKFLRGKVISKEYSLTPRRCCYYKPNNISRLLEKAAFEVIEWYTLSSTSGYTASSEFTLRECLDCRITRDRVRKNRLLTYMVLRFVRVVDLVRLGDNLHVIARKPE